LNATRHLRPPIIPFLPSPVNILRRRVVSASSSSVDSINITASSSTVEVAKPLPEMPQELTRTLSRSQSLPPSGQRPVSLTMTDMKTALGNISVGIGRSLPSVRDGSRWGGKQQPRPRIPARARGRRLWRARWAGHTVLCRRRLRRTSSRLLRRSTTASTHVISVMAAWRRGREGQALARLRVARVLQVVLCWVPCFTETCSDTFLDVFQYSVRQFTTDIATLQRSIDHMSNTKYYYTIIVYTLYGSER